MRKQFILKDFLPEIKILATHSPRTEKVQELVQAADKRALMDGEKDHKLKVLSFIPVVASTERWANVMYQSLYIRDGDPLNRLVLQEPPSAEPSVCVMVLKAARLSGESGMVYCGTDEQLLAFKDKLPEYEKLAEELDEAHFLECLVEVAKKEFKLNVIYQQISAEHGGDVDDYEDET